jgi:hypothetical protein
LLGIGLVIEIGQRLREFPELIHSDRGMIRVGLALVLFVALLIHQMGSCTSVWWREVARCITDGKGGTA